MGNKYIRAWGKMLGSYQYYIDNEVAKARNENAPQTAIYRNKDGSGTWATFEEITSEDTKRQIEQLVANMSD